MNHSPTPADHLAWRAAWWQRLDFADRVAGESVARVSSLLSAPPPSRPHPRLTASADLLDELVADRAAIEEEVAALEGASRSGTGRRTGPGGRRRRQRAHRLATLGTLVRQVYAEERAATVAALDVGLTELQAEAGRSFPTEQLPWDAESWTSWRPGDHAGRGPEWSGLDWARPSTAPLAVAVGELAERRSGCRLGIPALVELVGSGRPLVILAGRDGRDRARALLQSLILRIAVLIAGRARYTLLDPAGLGAAFPMARSLVPPAAPSADPGRDLEGLADEIRHAWAMGSGEAVPAAAMDGPAQAEWQVVAAAEFPLGYDRRAVDAMGVLARSGPRAGVQLLVHHDRSASRAGDAAVDFGDPVVIDLDARPAPVGGLEVDVVFDRPPSPARQSQLLDRLRAARPGDRPLRWADLGQPSSSDWWTEDATDRIRAPIGVEGTGVAACGRLALCFGVDDDQRPCAHGVLVAMTGAGKTALLHTLIAGLVTRYSPSELTLRLLDGKAGVGFQVYRGLPHADVISLRTSPELARSVLADLLAEMAWRNELFKRHGVDHFAAHRAAGSPEGKLPRILLIADEFQLLFDDDRDQVAVASLLRLSEQARSAGIHLLLGSQHFAPASMVNRNQIFANLHLRMAMQMASAEVGACGDFGPEGRRLIQATCTRTGRLVVNDRAGDDSRNQAGTVALLEADARTALLAALRQRCPEPVDQVVLDGDGQPQLDDSVACRRLLDADRWRPPIELENLAHLDRRSGGLGWPGWAAADRPVMCLLGQPFRVGDDAVAVLGRRPHEHVCVISASPAARRAVLASALATACVQLPPAELAITVIDLGPGGRDTGSVVGALVTGARSCGYEVATALGDRAAEDALSAAEAEMSRRQSLPEAERRAQPSLVVVVDDLDRAPAAQRVPDDFGADDSALGACLGRIVEGGASCGVHVIAGFSSLAAVTAVMAEKRLQRGFRHRVATQMSEDDSFAAVGSSRASQLSRQGLLPVTALHFDHADNRSVEFRPYGGDSDSDARLAGRLPGVFAQLAVRPRRGDGLR